LTKGPTPRSTTEKNTGEVEREADDTAATDMTHRDPRLERTLVLSKNGMAFQVCFDVDPTHHPNETTRSPTQFSEASIENRKSVKLPAFTIKRKCILIELRPRE
jgi:hypothetical protein